MNESNEIDRIRRKSALARQRYAARRARLAREQQEKVAKLAQRKLTGALPPITTVDEEKKAAIAAALARVMAKKAAARAGIGDC